MSDVPTRNRNKPKDPMTTVPKRDVFIVLPYLGLQSKFITKQLKSCICKFYGCIHLNSILALEINFSYNDEIVWNKYFEQKLTKMKSLLNLWYPRNLTLYGRITILKSLVNQAITQFVWNKKAKNKYRTMVGPKEQGGLDIPDFQIIDEALKYGKP